MSSVQIHCKTCNRRFRKPGQSRRLHCEDCRPPRDRTRVEVPAPVAPLGPGPLEVAVGAELERAGRGESWRGQVAVRLAREAEGASGTAVSSLLKQLEAAMGAALDGVPPEPDFVDEIAARRSAATA
jgi:hypothetical protein